MYRFFGLIIFISFIIFILLSILSAPLAKFLLGHYFSVTSSSNDWIGFAGNILGGILGGITTLFGVIYAFALERKKAIRDAIPNKILSLYYLKEELTKHKFTRSYNLSTTKQESLNNASSFLNELEGFTANKTKILENASQVDTDIFTIFDNYFKSIRIIDFRIKSVIENKDSETQQSINTQIGKATLFHTFVVEKAIEKTNESITKYIEEFHKKKKSKKLLAELDNHDYLR